jgi:hypothetical protein
MAIAAIPTTMASAVVKIDSLAVSRDDHRRRLMSV